MITATFVGTAVELLRVPELVAYVYRRMTAKTRLQKEQALRKVGFTKRGGAQLLQYMQGGGAQLLQCTKVGGT